MHFFHVDNAQGDEGVGYDLITGPNTMTQLGLKSDSGRQGLEWGHTVVPMKEPVNFLGQPE